MDCYLLPASPDELKALTGSKVQTWRIIEQMQQHSVRTLNLGEAWAGLHFLITGEVPTLKYQAFERKISWSDDSLENVLMGGKPIEAEASFGAARVLLPSEVRQIATKLLAISATQLSRWYDPQAFEEYQIPPNIWRNDPNALTWLSRRFQQLCALYQSAATSGDGIITYIL